jgi:motility quorum-sensing regulator/GCU-specific mRNA interferase toxin
MKGKQTPTYDLQAIQRLVREGRVQITAVAVRGAAALGISPAGIRKVVLSLTPADFFKSMEAEKVPGLWQDVYRPFHVRIQLYVKLQIAVRGDAVVIQLKRR